MLPQKVESYLLAALEGAPQLCKSLLSALSETEADFRPDPDRFTIREALCHIADWELIFTERLRTTVAEENPILQGIDEGEVARAGNYGARNCEQQLEKFAGRRAAMLEFIRSLEAGDWDRVAEHTEVGPITVTQQVILVAAHDAYHIQQFAEWRRLFAIEAAKLGETLEE